MTYTPTAGAFGATSVSVILKDDGGTANGGTDTTSVITFKIQVYSAPTVQSSEIRFSGIQITQFKLGWINGNGSKRAVFIKQANTGTATPVNGTTYTANTVYASGTQIGSSGWYTIYNGVDTTVTVTNLAAATDYIVQVFEYNGTTGLEGYNTLTATNNPRNATTAPNCVNPTVGGTIAAAQSICIDTTPSAFTSLAAASGQTGTLEYKWQSSTTSGVAGFTDIASSNSTTYSPGSLSVSTWYKRLARVSCQPNWTGTVESNVLKITVNTLPIVAAIAGGAAAVCVNSTTQAFTDVSPSGVWSIVSVTGTASITNGGVVTGLTAGTVIVTYTVTNGGCSASATKSLSITALPTVAAIAGGNATVCVNSATLAFTDATTGGTWSVVAGTGTASITTGGIVTGLTPGTVTVKYTITTGCGNSATKSLTIYPLPTVAAIAGGATSVCINSTTPAFTDATAGGTWSVVAGTGTASITTGGIVTGLTAGTVTVKYTVSTNGCSTAVSKALTISLLPKVATISGGATSVCINATTSPFIDATPGGTWSVIPGTGTASITATGIVMGLTSGSATIVYTVSSGGCSAIATKPLTINALPVVAQIGGGATTVCLNSSTPPFTDATAGGIWSIISGTGTANITTAGIVTGLTAGTLAVKYTITAGCVNWTSKAVTVNPIPAVPAAIGGTKTVCVGSTTTLTDATPSGVWSSLAPTIATVSSTGVVKGISAGTATIVYAVTNTSGCSRSINTVMTVNALATQPGAFTASSTTVNKGTSGVVYTVPLVAGVTYKWSYSGTGATIIGTTNSITVNFSVTATSGILSVTASTPCNTSAARSVGITVNSNTLKADTLMAITPPVNPVENNLTNTFKVYPNPAIGPAIFVFTLGESTEAKLDIYSLNGQHLERIFDGVVEAGVAQSVLFEHYLPTGIYPTVLSWKGKIITIKYVVKH